MTSRRTDIPAYATAPKMGSSGPRARPPPPPGRAQTTAPFTPREGTPGVDKGRRISTGAALAVLVITALAVPVGFLWASYDVEARLTTRVARSSALVLAQTDGASIAWHDEAQRLISLADAANDMSAQYVVSDMAGVVVARSGVPQTSPTLTRTAIVEGKGDSLGKVAVTRTLIQSGKLTLACLTALFVTIALVVQRGGARYSSKRYAQEDSAQPLENHHVKPETEKEVEERLRIVFENSIDGIMTCLPVGTVLSCNPATGRLFKQKPTALIGLNLEDLVAPCNDSEGDEKYPYGLHETVAYRKGGERIPVEITVSESRLKGTAQMIMIIRDITERKATQNRMAFLANYDSLTGLPNRGLFRDRLREGMKRAKRTGQMLGLMFLDLDRFKVVNDSLGHEVGDKLLQHVSQTLVNCLRNADSVTRDLPDDTVTVSRLGGDEFTVIIENIGGKDDAALIARRILDALVEPFLVGTEELVISTSIGISLYPQDDTDLDGLIRHTDTAMYRSKAMGRGNYCFFSPDMNAQAQAQLSLETSLRHALERNEFELHYQPKADLATGEITGVEALIRWNRPGEGLVSPERFVTLLEETGLILPVGAWVIRTACAEIASWDRLGLPPLSLAVNLSPRQFRQQYLFQLISDTLDECAIAPHRLELELTENQLMEDTNASRAILASIAELGVRVAIDDFGTGHSSLSYLKRFCINTIKIDRSFVREITHDLDDSAIATAVLALGHSLRLKVVAEGVETLHQADYLRALGCDEIQGYLLSAPLPSDKLVAWLKGYRHTGILLRQEEVRPYHDDWEPTTLFSIDP